MSRDYLLGLIRPRSSAFHLKGQFTVDYDAWRTADEEWKRRVLYALKNSLGEIESADERELPIPRKEVLTLAVATNQILSAYAAFYWSFFKDNQTLIGKAKELCAKFKVKGLMKATDYKWMDKPSKLEEKIEQALNQKGMIHCRRCGRLLTNPLSVKRGIGPICWKRIMRGEI